MSMKRLEALIEVAGRGWDEWEMEDDGTHDQDTMNAAKKQSGFCMIGKTNEFNERENDNGNFDIT